MTFGDFDQIMLIECKLEVVVVHVCELVVGHVCTCSALLECVM